MKKGMLSDGAIAKFGDYLILEEKSAATIEKYLRDVRNFASFAGERAITKEMMIAYKSYLRGKYAPRSVNSMLASVNSLLDFLDLGALKVKMLKLQRQAYCTGEKQLTRDEYFRLCRAAEAKGNRHLSLILQTICSTGIRVSELKYMDDCNVVA